MRELFESYKKGVDHLLDEMGINHSDYDKVLDQRNRLVENLDNEERFGDNPQLRSERVEILHNLDRIARNSIGKPFHELYEAKEKLPSHTSSTNGQTSELADEFETIVPPDLSLTQAQNYITSACNYVTAIHKSLQGALQLFSGDGDIWPLQCQNINHAFQKHIQPHMPENLNLSSLEGKLFFVSEQVRKVQECIDNFSPYGREKSAKARKMRHELREKLLNFPQCLTAAIEHINMVGKSLDIPFRCSLMTDDKESIK